MYAVVCWTEKNGVALKDELLESLACSKFIIMNGNKKELGAKESMVHRKDKWAGNIKSLHGNYIGIIELVCSVFILIETNKESLNDLGNLNCLNC